MRVLYCTVGMPASGKSTTLENLELNDYIISSDKIRELVSGYAYKYLPNENNKLGTNGIVTKNLSNKKDHQVWKMLYDIVEHRMKQGETIFIDSTMLFKGAFKTINKLRKKYYYRVHLIDFRHQNTNVTFDEVVEHNLTLERQRDHKVVPEDVLADYWKREENVILPKTLNPLVGTSLTGIEDSIYRSLEWKEAIHKPSSRTIVIGDVHGCYTALKEAMDDLGTPEDNPDDNYVFVGDYLDRGLENDKVFNWLYNRLNLPNLILLRGNHERHLEHFVQGAKITNKGFQSKTLPQLERAGFDRKEIDKFVRRLQDMYIFYNNSEQVVVTHAGLPDTMLKYPNDYVLLPESVVVDGIGGFKADVDEINKLSYSSIKQVHGHRNEFFHTANSEDNTINLEQRVERGGNLAIAVFSKSGIAIKLYKNNVYDSEILEDTDIDLSNASDCQIKKALNHSHNIKVSKVDDGLYANNFTREAFERRNWNTLSVTARGLFNDDSGKVIMRGFNKFFELGECEETSLDNIFANHKGNVTLTKKENGFLLLLGLYKGNLKVMTKGGNSNMAAMGTELINQISDPGEVQKWLSNHPNKTVLCECVYPGKDSHMVKYDRPTLYVLNVVNDEYEERYFPELVKDFSDTVNGFTPVETVSFNNTKQDIFELNKEINDDNTFLNYINQEGFVGVFLDGYHFKIKTRWYKTMKEFKHYLGKHGVIYEWQNMLMDINQPSFKQKDTENLVELFTEKHHWTGELPKNKEFGDVDLPNAFPEAYDVSWWKKNILDKSSNK